MFTFIMTIFFILYAIGGFINEWDKVKAREAVIEMNKRQKEQNGGR